MRVNTLEKRLQEERQRLGLTQDELAEIGGVKRLSQINYESGKRFPDSQYLIAIAAAGADVNYILTGNRSHSAATAALTREEAALLDNFRHIEDKGDQAAVKRMALLAAAAAKHEKESKTWNGVDRRKNNG